MNQIQIELAGRPRIRTAQQGQRPIDFAGRHEDVMCAGMLINIEEATTESNQKVLVDGIHCQQVPDKLIDIDADAAIGDPASPSTIRSRIESVTMPIFSGRAEDSATHSWSPWRRQPRETADSCRSIRCCAPAGPLEMSSRRRG